MKILAIETSCDETAAAVVENGVSILSSVVASSLAIHSKTGGIIPEYAAREQIKAVIPVVNKALVEAFSNKGPKEIIKKHIDVIAVTIGPGLIGSLLVGVETAKTLSMMSKKPLVPVNHLLGHIYANWLERKTFPKFPLVALVVSGGHTDLVYMKGHGKTEWIGGTRDDAAGEAFDKTARLLGLPYPGGPSISQAAANHNESDFDLKINLPRPMINTEDFDFSFSGLKTAVYSLVEKEKNKGGLDNQQVLSIAHETQEAITDVLVEKTLRAIEKYQCKTLLLGGGVAANNKLKEKFFEKFEKQKNVEFFAPEAKYCTDNAAYIASCAYFNLKPKNVNKVNALPELSLRS